MGLDGWVVARPSVDRCCCCCCLDVACLWRLFSCFVGVAMFGPHHEVSSLNETVRIFLQNVHAYLHGNLGLPLERWVSTPKQAKRGRPYFVGTTG
eukprot:scaffold2482_cov166-Amphora_coffeaeformis.AAC.10